MANKTKVNFKLNFSKTGGIGLPIAKITTNLLEGQVKGKYLPCSGDGIAIKTDNKYLETLAKIASDSPTHGAAIVWKKLLTFGQGFDLESLPKELQEFCANCNEKGDTINDILERVCWDWALYESLTTAVGWTGGKKIAEISIGQIEKRNKLAIETSKANKGIHPIDFFMGNTELDNLNSEIIANETLLRQLEDLRKGNTKALLLNPFSQYNAKGGGKGGKTPEQLAKDAEEALLKAQNVQVQNYIDTLDNRNKEIVKSELQLQEDIFTLSKAGFTNYESALLANSARIDDINSKYDEIEYKRNQKSINDNIQFENKLAKDLDRIDKEKLKQEQENYNTSLSYLKQYYNNKRDFATNNKEELKNIAIQEQATLDSLFIGGAINYEDYLKLSADSTAKFIKLTDDITKNAFDNMLKIGNGLMSALGPSLDLLLEKGENIGDVLSNAFQSILKQLAKVRISAAIAVALISILFPTKLTEAGGGSKLFGGLFLQGMGFGGNLFGAGAKTTEEPKKAANGGIFGGPAYRMIGEYPGAQSNPEIVAPLDKLKNLIGGSGGGTLEARISGNDLLILMNKAQRNNNLSF